MGEHSAPSAGKVKSILLFVRSHKAELTTLSVLTVALASRYIPGFPAEEVLRVVALLLGVA